jgi:hypothetical protein
MRTQRGDALRRGAAMTLTLVGLLSFVAWNVATGQPSEKPATGKDAAKDSAEPAKQPTTRGSGGGSSDADIIAYINEQIETGWKDNKITPAQTASNHEFLRRAYLDIVGRIPSIEEINTFFNARGYGANRALLVKKLLEHEDYAKNWANLWTVWLLTRTSPPGIDREKMHFWLQEQFALNKPYHEMVSAILTATGKVDENGAANFVASHVGELTPQGDRDRFGLYEMVPVTSRTTKLFLGIQTQCTQCHNHPFREERKQHEYWGVNTFFRQVVREPANIGMQNNQQVDRRYTVRDDLRANKELGVFYELRNGTLLKTAASYLDGTKLDLGTKDEPREINRRAELARFIIKDGHFAKAIVNRMWSHFMGRGFTNPVDDFGEDNAPSHPELLERLGEEFRASGFNLHRLITWITSSKPYHLTSRANSTNMKSDTDQYFSRVLLKALTPEQLVDSIFVATNAEQTKVGKDAKRQLYESWLRDFTVNFGDDEGNEATFNGTVVQALLLMNGQKLNDAIKNTSGSTLSKVMSMRNPNEAINHLFLAALTRPATGGEIAKVKGLAFGGKDPSAPLQDVFWALLNSNEFILNH